MFNIIRNPFFRGIKIATFYYSLAALIYMLLNTILHAPAHGYLLFVFLPLVILAGIIWAVVSLITIRRVKSQGALLVHLIVILLVWLLILAKPTTNATREIKYTDKIGSDSNSKELMPTFKKIDDQQKFLSDYQKELKSWPVNTVELDIETEFGKTHLISFGNPQGKPLILLHWFFSNSLEWKYMAPFLQERYRVYAIDVMGDMGKSYASKPPTSEKEVSQWFNQVLDGLGLKKVSLCGHSNGGFQTMLIAQQNPEKIEKLILLAPAAVFNSFDAKFYLTTFGTALFPKDYVIENFKNSCSVKPNQWSYEMTEMLALSFRVAAIQLKVFPRVFSDSELLAVKVPTLLILGEKEFIYSPKKSAERALRLLPNSKVIMLPDCGHAIPFDAPKEVSNAIDSFLSVE